MMWRTSKRGLIGISLLYISAFLWAQGPISGFMPKPGQLDLAYTYSQSEFDTFFDTNGDAVDRSLSAQAQALFMEYGADAKTALVATLPYIQHDEENRAWQDASLWLKYNNQRVEKTASVRQMITAIGLSTPVSRYANDNPQAIGQRATTFHGRLAWQSTATYGWFINWQLGIDFQLAPVAQAAMPLLLRGGFGAKQYYIEGWIERYQALGQQGNAEILVATPASSWTRMGGTLFLPIIPKIGVVFGTAYVLGGQNIGQSLRWNMGVVFRFTTRGE